LKIERRQTDTGLFKYFDAVQVGATDSVCLMHDMLIHKYRFFDKKDEKCENKLVDIITSCNARYDDLSLRG